MPNHSSIANAALALALLGLLGSVFGVSLILVLVTMAAAVLGSLCLLHWVLGEHVEPD